MITETHNKLPSLRSFYLTSALYTYYDVSHEVKQEVYDILFYNQTIDCFCPGCNETSIFAPIENIPRHLNGIPMRNAHDWNELVETTQLIVNKLFVCSRNSTNVNTVYIKLMGAKLGKIGQFPSLADIESNNIQTYKHVLSKSAYKEFSRANGLFSHGIGIGSFVYLRRLVELYIVKPAHDHAKSETTWNEELYSKARFKEKIDLLKDRLPDFLVSNPHLYSVISKGIHELSEEECLEFFPTVKACLEVVLTQIKVKKESDAAMAKASAELQKIAGKFS